MFKKWQQKWKVTGLQLALIITTFALGGSLCGYLGRKLLLLTGLEKGALWIILYLLLVTILWPLCVLLISIPLRQFGFFKRYVGKILSRFKRNKVNTLTTNIAIFSSGTGSNAKKIIEHFTNHPKIKVALIVCNNSTAAVLQIAMHYEIPSLVLEKEKFFNTDAYINNLKEHDIDLIVLAGFLWKVPEQLVQTFPKKIINIHPALLPAYGGKGMYGHFVHEAVIANKEKQSGITIHYADELYDHGQVIFQATCKVDEKDTPETLAERIRSLEHLYYATVIEKQIAC